MVSKICELKDMFLKRVDHDISERGIERIDVHEMGELVDIIKDLAEAEDYCWQAEYYRSITNAMDSKGARNDRTGYTHSVSGDVHVHHHEVIDPIMTAIKNAEPDERERLKSEIMSLIQG